MTNNSDDLAARLRRSLDSRGSAPELPPELVSSAATRTAPRLVNPARRMQLASGVTLAVAVVAVGSLVAASQLRQAPLFTAATGTSASAFAADDAASSSLRIAQWVNYEYVAGSGLSTAPGSGSVFQLERTGTAADTLRDVAPAFGLTGEPTKSQYFDEAYPTYVIGAEDGTAPSLVITGAGTGNWWFNDPTAYPSFVCVAVERAPGEAEPADDILVDPICEVPEQVAAASLAPSEPEARQQAASLFTATGLDVAAGDIRVTVDDWQTSASASLTVDGVATAIDWTVSWSAATGKVSSASGHSIDVVDRGSFGTVSAADAVGRLHDGRWFGAAGPEYQGGMSILAYDGARTAESPAQGTEGTEDIPAPDAPVDSPTEPTETPLPAGPTEPPAPTKQPVEPMPLPEPIEPETVSVTVEEAEATLLLMWDSEGNAWLVPGFAMQHAEGWWNTVVSLDEGVIELPEPIEFEPFSDTGRVD